jgi:hypothetical protein
MPISLEASEGEQNWTLESDLVRRVVAFEPGRGLSTRQLTSLATKRQYVGARGPAEFRFSAMGSLAPAMTDNLSWSTRAPNHLREENR